jgi:hypothetical protein
MDRLGHVVWQLVVSQKIRKNSLRMIQVLLDQFRDAHQPPDNLGEHSLIHRKELIMMYW